MPTFEDDIFEVNKLISNPARPRGRRHHGRLDNAIDRFDMRFNSGWSPFNFNFFTTISASGCWPWRTSGMSSLWIRPLFVCFEFFRIRPLFVCFKFFRIRPFFVCFEFFRIIRTRTPLRSPRAWTRWGWARARGWARLVCRLWWWRRRIWNRCWSWNKFKFNFSDGIVL